MACKTDCYQTDKLINNINRPEPGIALNCKKETTNENINVTDNHVPNLLTTEDDLSNVLVPSTQIHNNQGNMTGRKSLRRISNSQEMASVIRSKDFLWQLQS